MYILIHRNLKIPEQIIAEICQLIGYVIFRILKDDDILRSISNNEQNIDKLIAYCKISGVPLETLILITKYAYPNSKDSIENTHNTDIFLYSLYTSDV